MSTATLDGIERPARQASANRDASPATSAFTFGIEEEFFLTHPATRTLATNAPRSVVQACQRRFGEAVAPELLQSQIELVSPVFERHDQALETLGTLRRGIAEVAQEAGLRLMASGTHPIATWREQSETPRARYRKLIDDYQIVGRRNVVCGLHVHVGVPADVDRVVLMNRIVPWLPVFLALSTSSPFWNRGATGLLSYRQSAYDEWPRTGIPDHFENETEYDQLVERLVRGGAIKDASFLWWAIRPALRFPTLELRICDACTRLEDTVAIAGLYRSLLRLLARRPDTMAPWTPFTRRIVDENRWRAKRFGLDAQFVALDDGPPVTCRALIEKLLADVGEDAQALQCEPALARIRRLLEEGTSAHHQLRLYRAARERGEARPLALRGVVDWLMDTTVQ